MEVSEKTTIGYNKRMMLLLLLTMCFAFFEIILPFCVSNILNISFLENIIPIFSFTNGVYLLIGRIKKYYYRWVIEGASKYKIVIFLKFIERYISQNHDSRLFIFFNTISMLKRKDFFRESRKEIRFKINFVLFLIISSLGVTYTFSVVQWLIVQYKEIKNELNSYFSYVKFS